MKVSGMKRPTILYVTDCFKISKKQAYIQRRIKKSFFVVAQSLLVLVFYEIILYFFDKTVTIYF